MLALISAIERPSETLGYSRTYWEKILLEKEYDYHLM